MLQRLRGSEQRTREGSPWRGLWVVVAKDMADHLTSARMRIMEVLILITAGGTVFIALQNLRQATNKDQFLFLKLFTTSQDPIPAFIGFLSFLVPLLAITLAFDSINGEFNQGTLSRVLSQPIYRDALLFGKFLAGLFTLAVVMTAIWLLIIGLGIIGLGIPPSGEEVARILVFLLATILYGGVWLALALVFSTIFRQSATAAMASIAIWLFFMIFWNIVVNLVSQLMQPTAATTVDQYMNAVEVVHNIARISPNTLYVEATVGLLSPAVRSFGLVLPSQLQGALIGTPLPFGQSLLLIWPHLTGLFAITTALFAIAYITFQRQEIRA
jgi:ABC-2 type transport system permease protein